MIPGIKFQEIIFMKKMRDVGHFTKKQLYITRLTMTCKLAQFIFIQLFHYIE